MDGPIILIYLYSFFYLLLIKGADALSCRVCAEGGLDEFGECTKAFDSDCGQSGEQRVYCRTIRQRSRNGTYAIIKECVAEAAHFANFPQSKVVTRLGEECDVANVDGSEVAYCLCRTEDYCNAASIADQFTDFEKRYPEFFEPVESSKEDKTETRSEQPDYMTDERPRSYPALKSRNNEAENKQQLFEERFPTGGFTVPSQDGVILRPTPISPVSALNTISGSSPQPIVPLVNNGSLLPPLFSLPFLQAPTLADAGTITGGTVPGSNSIALSANTFANAQPQQIPSPISVKPSPSLSCIQCSEANLPNASSDCAEQIVVDCPTNRPSSLGRPLCFSRQIITQKGEYGVEKMCVPEKAVLEEFGEDAVLDGCATVDTGAIISRYCVCTTTKCNRANVAKQMAIGDKPNPKYATFSKQNQFGETSTTKLIPSIPTTVASHLHNTELSCVTCLDAELKDPMADCKRTAQQRCRTENSERPYCLTRQTQNGKNSFIIEKSCTTLLEFLENFPEERKFVEAETAGASNAMTSRCASTYDGYVNFCVCDANFCNRKALTQQAEEFRHRSGPSLNSQEFNAPSQIGPVNGNDDINVQVVPAFQQENPKYTKTTSNRRVEPYTLPTSKAVDRNYGKTNIRDGMLDDNFDKNFGVYETTSTTLTPTTTTNRAQRENSAAVEERLARWRATLAASASEPARAFHAFVAFLMTSVFIGSKMIFVQF